LRFLISTKSSQKIKWRWISFCVDFWPCQSLGRLEDRHAQDGTCVFLKFKGEKAFYIFSTNWKGEEKDVCNHIDTWIFIWKEKMKSLKNSWLRIQIYASLMEKCFMFGTAIIAFKLGDRTLIQTIPTNPTSTSRSIHLFSTQILARLICLQLWLT